MKAFIIVLSVVLLFCASAVSVHAAQYNVNFYLDDQNLVAAGSFIMCLSGTGQKGTWYAVSTTGFSGDWFRKGDILLLQGDGASGATHEAAHLVSINGGLMGGNWLEWSSTFSSWYQVKAQWSKAVCDAPAVGSSNTINTGISE